MAVEVDESVIKNASPDVKARNPKLYKEVEKSGNGGAKAGKSAAAPKPKPRKRRTPEQIRTDRARAERAEIQTAQARKRADTSGQIEHGARNQNRASAGTVRAARITRGAVSKVQSSQPVVGFGTVIVLITGAGVTFAIIRNPQLLTVPLNFVTSVVARMGSAFGHKTTVTTNAPLRRQGTSSFVMPTNTVTPLVIMPRRS